MNDYKELVEILNDVDFADCCEHCFLPCSGSGNCFVLKAADAIEQLVRERDAAVESIKQCWLCASCKKRIKGKEWASCKHFKVEALLVNNDKSYTCKSWEWRGVSE